MSDSTTAHDPTPMTLHRIAGTTDVAVGLFPGGVVFQFRGETFGVDRDTARSISRAVSSLVELGGFLTPVAERDYPRTSRAVVLADEDRDLARNEECRGRSVSQVDGDEASASRKPEDVLEVVDERLDRVVPRQDVLGAAVDHLGQPVTHASPSIGESGDPTVGDGRDSAVDVAAESATKGGAR